MSAYILREVICLKDNYLKHHHLAVMRYSSQLASILEHKLNENLIAAASLHDIGKIGISDEILFKKGPLSKHEWEMMRQHPITGAQLVAKSLIATRKINSIDDRNYIEMAIRYHHERWDGSGYPDGLKGEEIPLSARIIAVADAFDAMTTDRPYRKAMRIDDAAKEIIRNSGEQFDPYVVDTFVLKVLKI